MPAKTVQITCGGLKGGGKDDKEIDLILEFEDGQHWLTVPQGTYIREMMLQKRYGKAVVAPVALRRHLESSWTQDQVIKFTRRLGVRGEPIFPAKTDEPTEDPMQDSGFDDASSPEARQFQTRRKK